MKNILEDRAGQIDPELERMLHEAEAQIQAGNYRDAADIAKSACEKFDHSPLPFHAVSVIYLRLLQNDKEHDQMWEDLADDEGLFEAAVGAAETALDIDEEFNPARNNLAILFAMRGWWKEAIAQYETSLSIEPDQSQIRQDLLKARKYISQ